MNKAVCLSLALSVVALLVAVIALIRSKKRGVRNESEEAVVGPASDAKERLDALVGLSDQSQKKMESRRAIEWKLKLGIWVSIVLVTQFLLQVPAESRDRIACLFIIVFAAVAIFDFRWTLSVQRSHDTDQRHHLHYRWHVEMLAGLKDTEKHPYPKTFPSPDADFFKRKWEWVLLMWLPTPALLVSSYYLIFIYKIVFPHSKA